MKKQTYKKLFSVATASAMAAGAVVAVAPAQADAASPFSDVKETNTHYANIVELTQRGVITGYEDGTFRAGQSINRAQAAKIIAGILKLDTTNVKNPGFSDVSENNANYGSIAALANAGIINGFEGKFNPAGTLTRGQMAKIIDNAFNLSGGDASALPFADVQKSQYKVHIADLYANDVTTGVTATKFDEKSPVTRGQLASFVVRAEKAQQDGGNGSGGETTTSTVEKSVTLVSVTDNQVTINGEKFDIAPEVAGVFNADNAAALKAADTTLVIEYTVEKTASLANVAIPGKIVGIKTLTITQDGVKFDAKGYIIPTLSVKGNNVTLSNLTATSLNIAEGKATTLNNVIVQTLTAGKGAKVTINATTKIALLKLASGDKVETVIANYAAVKDQLKDTKVEGSTSGGGGGGGNNTPTTPAPENKYISDAETAVKNIKLTVAESVKLDGTTFTINVTTGDTAYTMTDLNKDVKIIFDTFKPLKADTIKYVSSLQVGTAPAITKFNEELSVLQLGQSIAEPLFGIKLSLTDLQKTADLRTKIAAKTESTVVVKFTNGSSKTYKVVVNNSKGK